MTEQLKKERLFAYIWMTATKKPAREKFATRQPAEDSVHAGGGPEKRPKPARCLCGTAPKGDLGPESPVDEVIATLHAESAANPHTHA